MTKPTVNLIVLRSSDIQRAQNFYSKLGIDFIKHRHGSGPEHISAELPGLVFEVYPQNEETPSSAGTRIGLAVASVEEAIKSLGDYPGSVISPPKDSEWGRRAVIVDPDGHRIELLEAHRA